MSLFLRTRCFKNVPQIKNINALVKCFSSAPSEPGSQDVSVPTFTPVFQFPYIRLASLINRAKFFQTISTSIAVPGSGILSILDVIEVHTSVSAAVIGLSLSTFFYILGSLTNKLIGIVYINEEKEFVRLAYLDFWGRRQEITLPLGEIVPLNETSPSLTDGLYLKVNCMSPVSQIYKINFRFGGIVDSYNFKKIFMVD